MSNKYKIATTPLDRRVVTITVDADAFYVNHGVLVLCKQDGDLLIPIKAYGKDRWQDIELVTG